MGIHASDNREYLLGRTQWKLVVMSFSFFFFSSVEYLGKNK
jgi:hypothetical protein